MPLEQISVKQPLFKPSGKPGKEHLEWCTDMNRIPEELPNVDKEIKTEKIIAKVYDPKVGAEVEKEINFPVNEQSFKVDGYGYKLFSDKEKMEYRLMRWKDTGRGSSRPAPAPEFSDHYFGWFTKTERKEADAKIKELNDQGMKVETGVISWTEKRNNENDGPATEFTETFQYVRGRKIFNLDGGAKGNEGQPQPQPQQQQGQSGTN
jgi:hypothetical protein